MVNVVVVGSVNTDLTIQTPTLPQAGETIKGEQFAIVCGGKGANQAVACARQGANVSFIGCIGGDDYGKQHLQNLQQENIDISHLKVQADSNTGVALILVDKHHQNAIVISPEANDAVDSSHIKQAQKTIDKADILICQLETPMEAVASTLEIASDKGINTLLNPAPAIALPESVLANVDILVPNETEIQTITGIEISDQNAAKKAVEYLLRKGVRTVVLTLGERGVLFANQDGLVLHEKAFNVAAVDPTAAGDTFIGCFTMAYKEGESLKDAIRYGQAGAALSVQALGAQTSIPRRQAVETFLRNTQQNN